MNVNDTRVIITIDDEEQISLRDFGYISDEDFGDKKRLQMQFMISLLICGK